METGVCGFSDNAVSMLTQRMTDLYTDPIMATVREVISNAVDATMLLPEDQRKPVEVSSPSKLNPQFIVKDHGVGMSLEDVKAHFSQYGASTKEEDLSQIGAYGLGSKAPLAYTSRFTVSTVKNGERTVFSMERDATSNTYNILDHEYTDDENGTIVSVPAEANDAPRFTEYSRKYSQFALEGVPIMVDGEASSFHSDWIHVYDFPLDEEKTEYGQVWFRKAKFDSVIDWYISRVNNGRMPWRADDFETRFLESFQQQSIAVLSGWPYALARYLDSNDAKIALVIKPGVVDFSSSRDEITENNRKRSLMKRALDEINPFRGRTEENKKTFVTVDAALDSMFDIMSDEEFKGAILPIIRDGDDVADKGNFSWDYVFNKRPNVTAQWRHDEKTPRAERAIVFGYGNYGYRERTSFNSMSYLLSPATGEYEILKPKDYSTAREFNRFMNMDIALDHVDDDPKKCGAFTENAIDTTSYNWRRWVVKNGPAAATIKIRDLDMAIKYGTFICNPGQVLYLLVGETDEKAGNRVRAYVTELWKSLGSHDKITAVVCAVKGKIAPETRKMFEDTTDGILKTVDELNKKDNDNVPTPIVKIFTQEQIKEATSALRAENRPALDSTGSSKAKSRKFFVTGYQTEAGSVNPGEDILDYIIKDEPVAAIDFTDVVNDEAKVFFVTDADDMRYVALAQAISDDGSPLVFIPMNRNNLDHIRASVFEDIAGYDNITFVGYGVPKSIQAYKALEKAKTDDYRMALLKTLEKHPDNQHAIDLVQYMFTNQKMSKIAQALVPGYENVRAYDSLDTDDNYLKTAMDLWTVNYWVGSPNTPYQSEELGKMLRKNYIKNDVILNTYTTSKYYSKLTSDRYNEDVVQHAFNDIVWALAKDSVDVIKSTDLDNPMGRAFLEQLKTGLDDMKDKVIKGNDSVLAL